MGVRISCVRGSVAVRRFDPPMGSRALPPMGRAIPWNRNMVGATDRGRNAYASGVWIFCVHRCTHPLSGSDPRLSARPLNKDVAQTRTGLAGRTTELTKNSSTSFCQARSGSTSAAARRVARTVSRTSSPTSASVFGPTPRTEPSSSSVAGQRSAIARMVALVSTDAGWRRSSAAWASRHAVSASTTACWRSSSSRRGTRRAAALAGPEVGEEPRDRAARPGARVPGARVRELQVLAGPGDPDVQQAALLGHRGVRLRLDRGEQPLGEPDQEHGVPLEALGGVQRRERDALDGRGVLGGGALVELGDQVGDGRRPLPVGGAAASDVGQRDQRLERVPALAAAPRPSAGSRSSRRCAGCPAPPPASAGRDPRRGRRRAAGPGLAHVRAARRTGRSRAPGSRCPGRPAPPRTPPTARWSGTGRRSRRRARRRATSAAIARGDAGGLRVVVRVGGEGDVGPVGALRASSSGAGPPALRARA